MALVALWVGILLLPHGKTPLPAFMTGAELAPDQAGRLKEAPFVKKLGPTSSEYLGTSGVSCEDYLVSGNFDEVQGKAKAELIGGAGWQAFFSVPEGYMPVGKMIPAKVMDALYTRGNEAITIFRKPDGGKVRVRLWHRSPSPLAHLF